MWGKPDLYMATRGLRHLGIAVVLNELSVLCHPT